MLLGMDPSRVLLSSDNKNIGEDGENSGIDLVKELPESATFPKTELCPTETGIEPVNLLFLTQKDQSSGEVPSEEEIVPVKLL